VFALTLTGTMILALLFASLRYGVFFRRVSGIPVFMYHRVSRSHRDFLTVTLEDFEKQLHWLQQRGYQSISMSEFVAFLRKEISRDQLPAKPMLFTFDDGYRDNVALALPVLKRMKLKAAIFVTSSFIEEREQNPESVYLSVAELRQWVGEGMELALHSHSHPNYRQISWSEISSDLASNRSKLKQWNLPYVEALAYPFGARPKKAQALRELKTQLKEAGLKAAFRIGNRIHSWSEFVRGVDAMDVCRIDVRGDDPFFEFTIKARKGRTKRF
jgi:peptidoglycan/xylan/chitin deacetylase (PgdA/CDA1 family)